MPRTKRQKPLYQRGAYSLYRRPDRSNLEIVWYDPVARRERSASARTSDAGEGRKALDKRYLDSLGNHRCPTCGREMEGEAAPLALTAITDYLTQSESKAGYKSSKTRLSHIVGYIAQTNPAITLPMIDGDWIDGFRKWMIGRDYSRGHTEGCVLQFAAAVNAVKGHTAQFKARSMKDAADSPTYRASIETLAAMFRFCLYPEPKPKQRWSPKVAEKIVEARVNLLRYLRAAVATWARPDAIYDLKMDGQWIRDAGVLKLNHPKREQTNKHRPTIPVAKQFAPWLDEAMLRENYLPVSTIRHGWDAMRDHLGLPGNRQAGEKLVRRSVATIARKRLGEANWVQGKMMLGHAKAEISDIYAIPDPSNFGLVLEVTESIIDDIEKLVPGAFYRNVTAKGTSQARLKVV